MKSRNVLLTGCWLLFVFLISACREDPPEPPIVKTTAISEITQTTATGGGEIIANGGKPITKRGICWSETNQPTTNDSKTTDGAGDGSFVSNLSNLTPGVLYYVRAYATNGVGTSYGDPVSFKTSPIIVAEITTTIVSDITSISAKSGGTIASTGGGEITACGVCWSQSHEPKFTDSKTTDALSGNTYISTLTNLEYFKTYYVRAYATNSAGTVYGNEREFKTEAIPPTVTTSEVTNKSYGTATAGGDVTADGGNPVTDKGICYATHMNPKFNENNKTAGNGLGPFTVNLTGLEPNTIYHVRAYAATTADTAYGADVEFKTLEISLPIVTTRQPYVSGPDMAISGGVVISDGGSLVTTRGVCWNVAGNPTVNDSKTNNGSGIGSFDSYLTGLSPYTWVYVRAYATTTQGTGYGEEFMFMPCTPPGIMNLKATNITGTSVNISFDVVSYDGSLPSYVSLIVNNQEGYHREFQYQWSNVEVTGLELGTIYYCFVMASNECGMIVHSEIISFTTLNTGTLSDVDGNTYNIIKIGTQIWMAENLGTTKLNDGTTGLGYITNNASWGSTTVPAYCWYDNDINNKNPYGALYNWNAVKSAKICPVGWHVPNDAEWEILRSFLGGMTLAGGPLKEEGTSHWASPNAGATNSSGFNGLPGGFRFNDGVFHSIKESALFWSTNEVNTTEAKDNDLIYSDTWFESGTNEKTNGLSIRCIKD